MSDQNQNRLGALWTPTTDNPNAPIAKGNIEINGEKIQVVVWRNKRKQPGEKTPDFYIEKDIPREQAQAPQPPADFSDGPPF